MNNLIVVLSFFIFFTILIIVIFNFITKKTNPDSDDSEGDLLQQNNNLFAGADRIEDVNKITIEPYGCFTNLKNQFFQERVNPYSKDKNLIDSSYYFTESGKTKALRRLILDVIKNGYSTFGNEMLKKYDTQGGNKNISLLEFAKLGKLAGYNYISVAKSDINSLNVTKAYFTYSPPTTSSALYKYTSNYSNEDFNSILTQTDLPEYTLTPKLNNYSSDISEKDKELACGFPCITFGQPETFNDPNGTVRQYMCGSINYPTLKTPERYAVYKING
jgi:hypothetical protein